jgi:phosphatidylserine synthase
MTTLIVYWIVSLIALCWLIAIAVFDIRQRKVPNPYWTGIPILAAIVFRVLSGAEGWMAAAAVVTVIISERRHLEHKGLEALALAAGGVMIALIFFSVNTLTQAGIAGILVFWISWELHYIGGADAMTLITCVLLWPSTDFLLAYLAAGLIWSLGVRIKEGGWRKSHSVPGLAIVALAGIFFLLYQGYLLIRG